MFEVGVHGERHLGLIVISGCHIAVPHCSIVRFVIIALKKASIQVVQRGDGLRFGTVHGFGLFHHIWTLGRNAFRCRRVGAFIFGALGFTFGPDFGAEGIDFVLKESQADLDLIFWIRVDLHQKGMRHDRGALDRALVFVVSPSIQDSVDERCRFRRGLARTFLSHIPAKYVHKYTNRLLSNFSQRESSL
jgi:hypothetical protein